MPSPLGTGPLPSEKGTSRPASLEDLLSHATPAPLGSAPATPLNQATLPIWDEAFRPSSQHKAVEILQAQAVRRPAAFADTDTKLLFVHSGTLEGTQAAEWIQEVLAGAPLHMARFQESVNDQILLLLPHVVFIHFEASTLALASRLVEQLRTAHPGLSIVAVGKTSNANCTLAALRGGMQDFLDIDGSSQTAQETVRGLIERSAAPLMHPDAVAPLTAILSARAGQGCSVLCSHLAYYLQQQLRQACATNENREGPTPNGKAPSALDVLLLDLGYPVGDCSTYLNLSNGDFDFMQALEHLRRLDQKLAASGLACHASGLRVLSLPKTPSPPEIAQAYADLLLLRLRQLFKHVIADLGAIQSPNLAQRITQRAHRIWLVCEQNVPSVVAAAQQLDALRAQRVDLTRVELIVNRHDSRIELSAEQIAKQLDLPLLATVSDRRLALSTAINRGALLEPELMREPYVQDLSRLTHILTDHQPSLGSSAPAARGLRRLFQRTRNA